MNGEDEDYFWTDERQLAAVRVWLGTGEPPPDAPTVSIGEEFWRASDIQKATVVVPTEEGVQVITIHSDGSTTMRPIEDFPLLEDQ